MYLNCHSTFSLRYGTLSPQELVALAKEHGIETLALTDIHSTSACYDFLKECREAGIHAVVGMEFRQGDDLLYVALARNLSGFREINEFYSRFANLHQPFPVLAPRWSDVYTIYPWNRRDQISIGEGEYLGIHSEQLTQLLRSPYRHRQDKLVVLQPLSFVDKRGYNIHRLLRAVDHNVILPKLRDVHHGGPREYFLPPDELRAAFADHPQILHNSNRLLTDCSFSFMFGRRLSKQTFTGHKYDDMLLLEKLAYEGLIHRYGPNHAEARRRVARELEVIDQLDFNAYYLITWDMIQYGRSRGFFHVGRGSGANSTVAYCLGITDVDPVELNLYFERFLNPKRTSPPDFDIDFSWQDRDAVIDYAFKRHRHRHTALLATYTCFRGRATVRELGKVFGLPKREIDKLVSDAYYGEIPNNLDKTSRQILQYGKYIEGFPNHLGIHAGGILISEEPIYSYTATNMPPKGFATTHFDMYVAEDIGLHKFDILSQRGLGHIKDAVQYVRENQGKAVEIHQVETFKQDPKVRALLEKGRTIGAFYIESPAMRMLLRKLRCNDYPTLVAASSIIRPGVSNSGMMRAYIERHNGRVFQHLHPRIGEILKDTYGVMVYQEDVIKVVHEFAGLDLAEADMLRRAMTGKSRDKQEFREVEQKFLQACAERGYDKAVVQELWKQIQSFAAYSFSKAHSASFAVESFQSLYLRAYFPLEFITAVVNNFGGFYDSEIYLHEARMLGAEIHAPCVNHSKRLSHLSGSDLYLGFIHLKDLGKKLSAEIVLERERRGEYKDLADFTRRVAIGEEQLMILIRIGAFRFTGKTKPQLLWEVKLHLKPRRDKRQADVLFSPEGEDYQLPDLTPEAIEDAYDEIELLGFPLRSPFSIIPHPQNPPTFTRELEDHNQQQVTMIGYLVTVKTTTTIHGDRMQFATFVDSEGELFDVTLFPREVTNNPLSGRGIYRMEAKVVREFGYHSLELIRQKKLLFLPDPRQVEDEWEQRKREKKEGKNKSQ